jgi:nitroimidazol reductase NimA-like FMN-containing flavoprotein (pyridoxamine 5'-phosphate oxidase superfamily)
MRLLGTEQIGRLALMVGHYPEIFPVNYRLDDFVVVYRTRLGTKLSEAHHRNIGFEVDHLDPQSRSGWSVLIRGMAEDIAARPPDTVTRRTQSLDVQSWSDDDGWLVRIIPAHVSGRRIIPAGLGWTAQD